MTIKRLLILIAVMISITGLVFLADYLKKGKPGETPETGSDNNFFSDIFNFTSVKKTNTDSGVNTPVTPKNENTDSPVAGENLAFHKISSMPIAGYGLIKKQAYETVANPKTSGVVNGKEDKTKTTPTAPKIETVEALRYIAKENGNIYQTELSDLNERRYSDITIPSVGEALFSGEGNTVFLRYIKGIDEVIETYSASLPKEILGGDSINEKDIKGVFFPENITGIAVSPNSNKVFYLTEIGNRVTGTTSLPSGANKNQVFDSPYTEWLAEWPSDNLITLTTKPASGVLGFMYGIIPGRSGFNRILGRVSGLTTRTSPNGKLVLYGDDKLNLFIYNTDTNELKTVSVKTLPEKCTWGKLSDKIFCAAPKYAPSLEYPDAWYQGEIIFNDNIWKIDPSTGGSILYADLSAITNEDIDAVNLTTDDKGDFLFFVNKKDLFLWELILQ